MRKILYGIAAIQLLLLILVVTAPLGSLSVIVGFGGAAVLAALQVWLVNNSEERVLELLKELRAAIPSPGK